MLISFMTGLGAYLDAAVFGDRQRPMAALLDVLEDGSAKTTAALSIWS